MSQCRIHGCTTIGPDTSFSNHQCLDFCCFSDSLPFINVSVTLEITPTAFNMQPYCKFLSLEIFRPGLDWSISVQISVQYFLVLKYLQLYIFRSGKAFQFSALFIPQIGVILLPFFALKMWGLSTSLSIWSSKSDPYHHGYPSYAQGRGAIHPPDDIHQFLLCTFRFSETYDQMRLPHVSFWS